MTERRYVLTRITAGDYLLPSNDARRLYRISVHYEDGSASSLDRDGNEHVIRGTFWQAACWHTGGLPTDHDVQSDDFLDWMNWHTVDYMLPTRAAAIEAALS